MFGKKSSINRALIVVACLISCVGCSAQEPDTNPLQVSALCGDGSALDEEACDGDDLRGRSCEDFGYPAGELACNEVCTGVVVEACQGVPGWSYEGRDECFDCAPDEACVYGECVPVCDGQPLESDALVLDVATVTVDGQLGMPGELPASNDLGSIVFVKLDANTPTHLNVSASLAADGHYEAEVYAGTYAIYWTSISTYGHRGPSVRLASEVVIDSGQTLDFALPDLVNLTLEFEPPDDYGAFGGSVIIERLDDRREDASFAERKLHSAIVAIDPEQTPRVQLAVAAGTYRARLESSFGNLGDLTLAMSLFESRQIDANTLLNVPVDLHTVSGMISLPDQLPQDLHRAAVHVEYENPGLADDLPPYFASVDGRFEAILLPGTYKFSARTGRSNEPGSYDTRTVEVGGDMHLDFVVGKNFVPVNGRIEPASAPLSSLSFIDADAQSPMHHRASLTDGHFATSLAPGRYHVQKRIRSGNAYLGEITVDQSPLGDLVLEVAEPGAMVSLRGQVTVNGEPMPDNTLEDAARGMLKFVCNPAAPCGETTQVEIGASGEAKYDVNLAEGTYQVQFLGGVDLPDARVTSNAVAAGLSVVDPNFRVYEGIGRRDFDIKQTRLTATITAGGGPLPVQEAFDAELSGQRGPLQVDRLHHPSLYAPLAEKELPAGPPTSVQLDLLPGLYSLHVPLPGFGPHRSNAGQRRWIEVSDDIDLQWDVALHRADLQLTYNGAAWAERYKGTIDVTTQLGTFSAPIGPDGEVEIWWLGDDPSIYLRAHEGALPYDVTQLRRGCASRQGLSHF